MRREVEVRHGRLVSRVAVTIEGDVAEGRIMETRTRRGEAVLDPLDSDEATAVAHEAIRLARARPARDEQEES